MCRRTPFARSAALAAFVAVALTSTAVPAVAQSFPFTCRGAATCRVDVPALGLASVPVRPGWRLAEPYFYETAGGARASAPTIEMSHGDGEDALILNGRQISANSLYDCRSANGDEICLWKPVSHETEAMARELRRWRRR